MARISELHYSNALARSSGVDEFLEVALGPSEVPADFTVSFYQSNGSVGFEVALDDPGITVAVDPDNGEVTYVISASVFPILLTDPDGGGANNYEAYALTNTVTGQVIDFYDIGGGTQTITAQDGQAAGAVSENVPVLVGPNQTTTTLQWNQPNPDTLSYGSIGPGDTGLACFVKGTRVDTPYGARPIETLRVGDLVLTHDHGPRPVRWIGQRCVDGTDRHAPVLIRKGAMGVTRNLKVSPQHRVLLTGWKAEMLFGEAEILVPAASLLDGRKVVRKPVPQVTYVHMLFDMHELVQTHGLVSESLLPTGYSLSAWSAGTQSEILSLVPRLAGMQAGWPPARPIQQDRRTCLLSEARAA